MKRRIFSFVGNRAVLFMHCAILFAFLYKIVGKVLRLRAERLRDKIYGNDFSRK